jgi:23S rRNA pseudouridine1911/1915/1917 synthase
VAGERKKAGYQVYAEEEIDVLPLPQAPTIAVPQEIPLEVLCEDEYLAAINKPVGMVVHPAPGRWEGTVVNALLFRWGQTEVADTPRLGIVHRLDKETSGVLLVVAKDPRTQEQLARQFKERQIDKAYVAVVVGHFSAPAGEIALQLEEQGVERPRKRVR